MGASFLSGVPGTHHAEAVIEAVAAGDATEEQVIFVAPFDCILESVSITADAAVTGNNTNTKNLNVVNKGSAGVGSTELANLDLATGTDLVAADEKSLGTVASNTLAEGDVVALEIEKVGTGVAIPRSVMRVGFRSQ